MCGLTKLGTNVVTISSKATINDLCIHDTSILAFTFKVTHRCILTVKITPVTLHVSLQRYL